MMAVVAAQERSKMASPIPTSKRRKISRLWFVAAVLVFTSQINRAVEKIITRVLTPGRRVSMQEVVFPLRQRRGGVTR